VHVAGVREGLRRKKDFVGEAAEAPEMADGEGCESNVSGVDVGDAWLGKFTTCHVLVCLKSLFVVLVF